MMEGESISLIDDGGDEQGLNENDLALMGIINGLDIPGSDAEVAVFRNVPGKRGGMGAFLFRCEPGDLSVPALMERLRDEYGGGEFRVRVTEGTVQRASRLILVEKPVEAPEKIMKNTQNDIAALIMQMQESNRQQAESLREMMFSQQRESANMMLEIVKATASRPASEGPSMAEMVQTIVALQGLNQRQESGANPEKMLDMYFKGIEQGKELSGNAGEESILQTAIKAFGPSLGDITAALQKNASNAAATQAPVRRQRAALPEQANRPRGEGEPPAKQAEPASAAMAGEQLQSGVVPRGTEREGMNTDQTISNLLQKLEPFVQMLVIAASKDGDPEVYANVVLDQLDENMAREWILDDTKFDILRSYLPVGVIQQYGDWFDELRACVLALLEDFSEVAENSNVPERANTETISDEAGKPA